MYEKSKLPEFSQAVVETKRTFSPDLLGLIAWLETQEPETTYCIDDEGVCLFGQFHKALGIPAVAYFDDFAGIGTGLIARYPKAWSIASRGKRTFGAALSRARAALESQP